MEQMYLISDAAKKVEVETHVLRYWEEELNLPIKRNNLGHRYYSEGDIARFQEVKRLKDTGIGLKAIKSFFEANQSEIKAPASISYVMPGLLTASTGQLPSDGRAQFDASSNQSLGLSHAEPAADKSARLQFLLKQLIAEAVRDSNEALIYEVKDSLLKELDYQFRNQEEREEKREENRIEREESHYRKLDEMLRSKAGSRLDKSKRKKHPVL